MEQTIKTLNGSLKASVVVKENATDQEKETINTEMVLSNVYDMISELVANIDNERNREICEELHEMNQRIYSIWKEKYSQRNENIIAKTKWMDF